MICWERRRKGWLVGMECLALQGVSAFDIQPENLPLKSGRGASLAGDMINLVSYSQVLIGALAALTFPADFFVSAKTSSMQ